MSIENDIQHLFNEEERRVDKDTLQYVTGRGDNRMMSLTIMWNNYLVIAFFVSAYVSLLSTFLSAFFDYNILPSLGIDLVPDIYSTTCIFILYYIFHSLDRHEQNRIMGNYRYMVIGNSLKLIVDTIKNKNEAK